MHRRRLPSLKTLRTFEAAARLNSFKAAAEELGVTPSAVSMQVRTLEDFYQTAFFHRAPQSIELTASARTALPSLTAALDQLYEAALRLAERAEPERLVVTAPPTFAMRWLAPRLRAFEVVRPDIQLHIDASERLLDLAKGEADVAIRFGAGRYQGMIVDRLMTLKMVPVCAPQVRDGSPPIDNASDILAHRLLHLDNPGAEHPNVGWSDWLRMAGIGGQGDRPGPSFSTGSLALEAAAAGYGIALLDNALVEADLASGRLVEALPSMPSLAPEISYQVVTAPAAAARPSVNSFREWIMSEGKR